MKTILTQDKDNIIPSAENIMYIRLNGTSVIAELINGTELLLGKYEKKESALKVMTYIAFALAANTSKAIPIPSEDTVVNSREIVENFLNNLQKGSAFSGDRVNNPKVVPPIDFTEVEHLRKFFGGEDK